jgi:hypothetical protein
MFQDSAGTTPVTAVEQPVGLILDKSKGLAIGSELVANGNFSTGTGTTGWTPTACTQQIVGSELETTCTVAGFIETNATITTVVGSTYTYTANVRRNQASGTARVTVGGIVSGASVTSLTATSVRIIFKAAATTTTIKLDAFGASIGDKFSYSIASVRELPGNHASQSTSASRPVLSARVNLLTYSEQFDNAAWLKFSVAVPATKYADPYGGTTANLLYPTAATTDASLYRGGFATVGKTHSYAVKAAGKSWFCILKEGTSGGAAWFNLSTGLVGTVAAGYAASNPVSLGNGWYRCTVTSTSGFSQYTAISAVDADNSTTPTPNGTDGIYIWGADLRVTNDGVGIPAYQRVAAATDYDTSGFPLYLKFDGTDDKLVTNAFSVSNPITVFSGIRFNSAAPGYVTDSVSGTRLYNLTDGSSRQFGISAGLVNIQTVANTINIETIVYDGASSFYRKNGTLIKSGNTGTGTISTGLVIGAQFSGTTLDGRLYSLIVRGAQSTDAQIASTETWVNGKTKAY